MRPLRVALLQPSNMALCLKLFDGGATFPAQEIWQKPATEAGRWETLEGYGKPGGNPWKAWKETPDR